MRRSTVTLSAALMLLVFAPASALAARHHDSRRHHRHIRHARVERFGRDVTSEANGSAENAGTVQSFSGGRLTIMVSDGSTVRGTVTNDTELECMAPGQSQAIHEDADTGGGDQNGGGDNQSRGSDDQSSGEDQAEDQGEDQAEDVNEDQAEDRDENEAQTTCSTASLTHGALVREAELRISSAGAVWKKVELGS